MSLRSMTREAFTAGLAKFATMNETIMKLGRELSEAAISHYSEHGDLVYCQELYDAMPKNWARRVAFLKWLGDFSPVTMVNGKFLKDKSATAKPFNLEAAFEAPFWEYAPDPEQIFWGTSDVVESIKKKIGAFRNKRHTPNAVEAEGQAALLVYLAEIEKAVLSVPVPPSLAKVTPLKGAIATVKAEATPPAETPVDAAVDNGDVAAVAA